VKAAAKYPPSNCNAKKKSGHPERDLTRDPPRQFGGAALHAEKVVEGFSRFNEKMAMQKLPETVVGCEFLGTAPERSLVRQSRKENE
jgi:hypothetical protein